MLFSFIRFFLLNYYLQKRISRQFIFSSLEFSGKEAVRGPDKICSFYSTDMIFDKKRRKFWENDNKQ